MHSYEQQLYGVAPDQNTQDWLKTNLQNGRTIQDVRWEDAHSQRMTDSIVSLYSSLANYTPYNAQITSWQNTFANAQSTHNSAHYIIAHGSEATAALTTAMQMVTGQQPSNSAALQPYQDAMANGGSLNDAIYKFAHSDLAKIVSNIFIAANIGPATVSLINASETMLTNIAQAYQSMKNYSESQIQSTANGYHAAFRAGDALNSVMPNTWEGWLGLTATIVIFMTPPEEAVAIAEVAAIGEEELLSLALDTETNIALDSLYATGTSDLVTTVSQSEIDILAQFTPRQSGATLDLGNGVIVTQTEGNLKKAGALIFKGGNFDAVSSYFKTLTGYSGDLEAIKNNTSTIPEGAAIYKIKTNLVYVSMRNITSSIGDFTIEFTNRLNNSIKEIKFLF
ncbi:hypothetical protein KBX73_03055 [Acetobacter persici]|uniref:hypothetical protein n=1 Tax=Acetobacter persici TaxID=1076596 RepID=UPI0020CB926E|nr:hypothetical protein [Acetobacter persici]MCP9318770.1 hypothetical protein [Acetobacter persici]